VEKPGPSVAERDEGAVPLHTADMAHNLIRLLEVPNARRIVLVIEDLHRNLRPLGRVNRLGKGRVDTVEAMAAVAMALLRGVPRLGGVVSKIEEEGLQLH